MLHRIEFYCTLFVVALAAYFALKKWCDYRDGEEARYHAALKEWHEMLVLYGQEPSQEQQEYFDRWFLKMKKRKSGYVARS
jgi:hypothetical protein